MGQAANLALFATAAGLFRSPGLDVETFAAGRGFLESLRQRAPDCLVLDLHLAGLTGFAVQRQPYETGVRRPTISITGKDEPSLRERAAGADAYLLKRFDDQALLAAVTVAVRERVTPPVDLPIPSPGFAVNPNHQSKQTVQTQYQRTDKSP